ncbi:MAG: putative RNA methyltransferase [Propionibacteriaceae bacterium]
MALDDVLDWLVCPHCRQPLSRQDRIISCSQQHHFDIAKQGHLNLLATAQPHHADTADMVARRLAFLDSGHYDPIVTALAKALTDAVHIIDIGAGPGWYLSRLLEANSQRYGLATDISVAACRRAAKAHRRGAAIVADSWQQLPVRSESVDAITCIFAPRNSAEFARILAQEGKLVVAIPGPEHLLELRQSYDLLAIADNKYDLLVATLADHFVPTDCSNVTTSMELNANDVANVIAMGPNAFHQQDIPSTAATVTLDVTVATFCRSVN